VVPVAEFLTDVCACVLLWCSWPRMTSVVVAPLGRTT
jgi:hypothetical protein